MSTDRHPILTAASEVRLRAIICSDVPLFHIGIAGSRVVQSERPNPNVHLPRCSDGSFHPAWTTIPDMVIHSCTEPFRKAVPTRIRAGLFGMWLCGVRLRHE